MTKKKWLKRTFIILTVTCLMMGSVLSVAAAGRTRDALKSCGRIDGDSSVFDSADLYHIADRIDVLKEACR